MLYDTFVDLFVLYTLMFRVMIPLTFTWDVLWIVDNRVNKTNIFFLRFTSPRFTSPRFTSLRFTSRRFTSPRFTSPRFTSPRFTSPRFTSPVQSSPVREIQYAPGDAQNAAVIWEGDAQNAVTPLSLYNRGHVCLPIFNYWFSKGEGPMLKAKEKK